MDEKGVLKETDLEDLLGKLEVQMEWLFERLEPILLPPAPMSMEAAPVRPRVHTRVQALLDRFVDLRSRLSGF